jgi:hypothetical protein
MCYQDFDKISVEIKQGLRKLGIKTMSIRNIFYTRIINCNFRNQNYYSVNKLSNPITWFFLHFLTYFSDKT